MTTSRTGTAAHKRWRKAVLRAGQAAGVTTCPTCNVPLDYTRGKLPNSAEPDHLIPWIDGGRYTLDNGRVLCRRCNQRRGNKPLDSAPPARATVNLVEW